MPDSERQEKNVITYGLINTSKLLRFATECEDMAKRADGANNKEAAMA